MKVYLSSLVLVTAAATAVQAQDGRSPLAFDVGQGITVTPYGYIKLDIVGDDEYVLGRTTAPIRDIGLADGPADGPAEDAFLNETRIGVDVDAGEALFKLEGDFYGEDDSLRLRLGYLDWRWLRIGQDWTTFMSTAVLPKTVDFQGSAATPFARVPMFRVTVPAGDRVTVSAALEEDVQKNGDPAFALSAKYALDQGSVFASAITRDTEIAGDQVSGWGVNLSGVWNAWDGGSLRATASTGDGIADYLSVGFSQSDLTSDADHGRVNAAMLSATHDFTDTLTGALTATWVDFPEAVGVDTETLTTLHMSAFYTPIENTTFMAEVFVGDREQDDGASFNTSRLQVAVKYSF
ncbi:hypothetical protein [Oceanomicrobium pacificus]|uniref:Porin n=1 Tax=Oceanomicrobium pacificus TaxID=2692916 RepID=A0A6B0TRE2_9RHOB|nr:hypothetical protein [Oceanomicrobium pacificus]MXU64375.1 hypothetical protein [Oceanomicrobium pacificus]